MTERERREWLRSMGAIGKIAGFSLLIVFFLFFHVWWPIQAQRSLVHLRRLESSVSEKKNQLMILQQRYRSQTSLVMLEQWSKKNGVWHAPREGDVVALQ